MPDTSEGAPESALPPPRVLLVDDVAANLTALEALLEGMGCNVVAADSGNVALRALLKQRFAVMLLDIQMPSMDGYEVASHVRQNPKTRDTPIIFLTAARGDEEMALRAYGSGAVDFLRKPVNPSVLRSKVGVFLELARERERLSAAKASLEASNAKLEAAYRELAEAQTQLVQSAKMASLGQLVAGVAHEINNPLAFSVSHLATACKNLDTVEQECGALLSKGAKQHWERARTRLNEMNLGLERISDLVVKLRTFSRLDEGEFKEVSVSDSIGALLTIVRHRLRDKVKVETHFGEPDTIACFPALMNQAVMNLVVNAIDSITDEGSVSIETGAHGGHYEIVVTDTGSGISDEHRERVFEPFFTTKKTGEGTGLGLSLAYSIVKRHGGTLSLDRWARGTRASIRIPRSDVD